MHRTACSMQNRCLIVLRTCFWSLHPLLSSFQASGCFANWYFLHSSIPEWTARYMHAFSIYTIFVNDELLKTVRLHLDLMHKPQAPSRSSAGSQRSGLRRHETHSVGHRLVPSVPHMPPRREAPQPQLCLCPSEEDPVAYENPHSSITDS